MILYVTLHTQYSTLLINGFLFQILKGLALYELVRSPYELIENPGDVEQLKLNYEYYVMKQIIPPLQRIMALLDANVYEWIKPLSLKPKVSSTSLYCLAL